MSSLLWFDDRVPYNPPPSLADKVIKVDSNTPLGDSLKRIRDHASATGGIDTLRILAHGEGESGQEQSTRTSRRWGGGGIVLCRENLDNRTVSQTSVLNGWVGTIVVYACAAAETRPGSRGTAWDGRRLMKELAHYSGAVVYASDSIQGARAVIKAVNESSQVVVQPGSWEGNVLRFDPDGSEPQVVSSAPPRP